jgi:IS5 family transposase
MNPYYQVFFGETSFRTNVPCHSTELVKFQNRLGEHGVEPLFKLSVALHGEAAEEFIVLVDTTVQEKAIFLSNGYQACNQNNQSTQQTGKKTLR